MLGDDIGSVLWKSMKKSGAVWEFQYQGNPRAPHVGLRSGKHSDGFIDTLQYLSNVDNLAWAARTLVGKLKKMISDERIDWVFGSPMAGIPFATACAMFLGIRRVGFTEKAGGDKELTCRFDVPARERFIVIEEMTTTGATSQRGIEAVLERNPKAVPLDVVGSFLIRCDEQPPALRGKSLISLISLPELGIHYGEWEPSDCPLCKKGSRLIKNCKQVWSDLLQTMDDPNHSIPVHGSAC